MTPVGQNGELVVVVVDVKDETRRTGAGERARGGFSQFVR